jgi:hypothetical protein
MMKIKYGRGHLKAKVLGTYTRYIGGKKHTSHHIRRLDLKREAHHIANKKLHHATEQFTDLKTMNPKTHRYDYWNV